MRRALAAILLCVPFLSAHAQESLEFVQEYGARGWSLAYSQGIMPADDFSFSRNASIDQVSWWSAAQPAAGDAFDVSLYANNNGVPGAVLFSGQYQPAPFYDRGAFRYTVLLSAPVDVQANATYWLSVGHASRQDWIWSMSSLDNRDPDNMWNAYRMGPDQQWIRSHTTELAFAIHTVPEPSTWATALIGFALLGLYRRLGQRASQGWTGRL